MHSKVVFKRTKNCKTLLFFGLKWFFFFHFSVDFDRLYLLSSSIFMLWRLLVAWSTGNLSWLRVHAAFTIFAALKIGKYDTNK